MKPLLLILVLSAFSLGPLPASAGSVKKIESVEDLSREAYIWGYPLVLLSQAREEMLGKTSEGVKSVNHFFHSPKVPDPFLGHFVSVNPENLYSWAWVDLRQEPLVLTHPPIPDRFYSTQFVDAYSNVFHTLSNRASREKDDLFVITAPGWKGDLPENMTHIRASTPEILILAQIFVKDPKETSKVAKLASQRHLLPLSQWKEGRRTDTFNARYPTSVLKINKNLAATGLKYFKDLRHALAKNPPPVETESNEMKRFSTLGLRDQSVYETLLQNAASKKSLERGLFEGEREIQERLAAGMGAKINGWNYELKAPPFTKDYLLRAAASQRYLFSSPATETMQMDLSVDSESRQLTSGYRYALHFEKDNFPPGGMMWSFRVHEMKSKNIDDLTRPISFINDKSSKLKYNMDGSVDILLQSEKPEAIYYSNWLALSRNSNFYLVLTLFNPGNSVLNRKYIPPSLTRMDENSPPKQRITHTMIADAQGPVSK